MSFREIVRLSKEKILVSIAFSAVLMGLIFLFNASYRSAFLGLSPGLQAFSFLLSLAIGMVIYYPLACGTLFIYRHFSEGKKKKYWNRDLALAIILILVFNPVTYSAISMGITYVNYNVINHPCGIQVVGFQEISPARDAGMKLEEVITGVDGRQVDTVSSLAAALAGKKDGDLADVKTETGEYAVKIAMDNGTRPIMGIIINQLYCSSTLYAVNQTALPADNASLEAFRACQQSCVHTLEAGDNASLQNGPCLLDPINVQPDWVCDIAHSPRQSVDELPENQCSFYRSGRSVHFIELSPECRLLRAG